MMLWVVTYLYLMLEEEEGYTECVNSIMVFDKTMTSYIDL